MDFLLGHNLIDFDLPHLRAANPDLRLLQLPAVDTLRLNPLAFPRNPYHYLVSTPRGFHPNKDAFMEIVDTPGRASRAAVTLVVSLALVLTFSACESNGPQSPSGDFLDLIRQANQLYEAGEYNDAIAAASRAIQLSPDNPMGYLARGNAYRGNKDYDRAIADFDAAIAIAPTFGNAEMASLATFGAYQGRASTYLQKQQPHRAITDYSVAIALDPDNPEPHLWRAIAYHDIGDYDSAIADFDAAIALNPDDAEFYRMKGVALREKGEYERAIANLEKAIALAPNSATVYVSRGLTYSRQGKHDRAVADYGKAIDMDPKDASLYRYRGSAYSSLGEYANAVRDYDRALELEAYDAESYYFRGVNHTRLGNNDEAMRDYNRALSMGFDETTVKKALAELP